jgi:hypothetical protein
MQRAADNDAPTEGCHPLLVCTDRPELCPPWCRPVIRNAGTNDTPSAGCQHDPRYSREECAACGGQVSWCDKCGANLCGCPIPSEEERA